MGDIQAFEPLVFTAGDSLIFQRDLPEYLPADGWSLQYLVFGIDGKPTGITANSTASGRYHLVAVDGFAGAIKAGEYLLAGFAIKNSGERHAIYRGELTLLADMPAGETVAPVKPFELQMVEACQARCLRLAQHELIESDVQRVKLVRAQLKDAQQDLNQAQEQYQNFLKAQRVANGQSSGNELMPVFRIC